MFVVNISGLVMFFGLVVRVFQAQQSTIAPVGRDIQLYVTPLDSNIEDHNEGPGDGDKDHTDVDGVHQDQHEMTTLTWSCYQADDRKLDHYEINFELIRVIPPEDKLSMHFHSQQRNQLVSILHDGDTNVERTRIFLIKVIHRNYCEYATDLLESNSFYRVEVAAITAQGDVLQRSKFVTFRTANKKLCYDEMQAEIVMGVMVIVVVWTASMIALMRNWGYLHLSKHAMHTTKHYRPKNLDKVKVVKHQCDSVIYRPSISLNRGRRISAPAAIFTSIALSRPPTASTSVVCPSPNSANSTAANSTTTTAAVVVAPAPFRDFVKSPSSHGQNSFPVSRDAASELPQSLSGHANQAYSLPCEHKTHAHVSSARK